MPGAIYADLARLAALACDAEAAFISLVEPTGERVVATSGIDASEVRRDAALPTRVVAQEGILLLSYGDGDRRSCAGAPLLGANGRPIGAVCVIDYRRRDFSDAHKEALTIVARRIAAALLSAPLGAVDDETDPRALEAIRKRSAFVASMGHELRTPLNSISGYSEMLGEMAAEQGQAELARDLQRIHGAGRRALGLVNDMVELLKLDAGTLVLRPEPFAVSDLFDDLAAGARSIEAAGTRVELRPGADLGSMVADRLRVREALLRFLEGAAGLDRGGTVGLSITREAGEGAGRLVVRATSSGGSISPVERERLLGDAFERPEGSEAEPWIERMRFVIARMLFRRMGGDATVEGGAGGGTTFLAVLPAEPPAPGSPGERFHDAVAAAKEISSGGEVKPAGARAARKANGGLN